MAKAKEEPQVINQVQDKKVLLINSKDYPRNIVVNNEVVVLPPRSKSLTCYKSELNSFDQGVLIQEVK